MIRTTVALIVAASFWPAAARADDESAETAGVLKLPVDRQVETELKAASERISRGEYAAAEAVLAQLWRQSGAKLAEIDGEIQPVNRLIRSQIARLPQDRQSRFWERVSHLSADAASPADFDLPTREGYLAWRSAAMTHRDRGEFDLAVAAWRQAARHSAASPDEAATSWMHALELQWHLSVGGVEMRRESISEEIRRRPITIAGEPMTIAAWLQRHPQQSFPRSTGSSNRPASSPVWTRRLITPDAVEKGWRQAADELREQGVIRLPAAQSCVIGSRLVARTPDGLICLDSGSGDVLWQVEEKWAHDRLAFAGQVANPFFSGKLLTSLAQHAQANTLAGDLSHDGRLVYQVVEAVQTVEPAAMVSRYALQAVDIETGRIRWRAGGAKPGQGEDFQYVDWTVNGGADYYSVCGAPLVLGGRLYLLSMQNADLVFQCIDAESLTVEWSCLIGHLLPEVLRVSPQKYTAARIVWTGDQLACVANCGVVAAVDPVRQQIRWINRFPVEIREATGLEPSGRDPIASAVLHSWREARIFHSQGMLVSISPESPNLHVIDAESGRTKVRIPRGDALTVLGVNEESIFLLEPTSLRAVAFDGRSLWRTVTCEVRGRGVVTGDRIVQPLADGSVAILDQQTGRQTKEDVRSAIEWGNLAATPAGWLSADVFQVQMFAEGTANSQALVQPVDRGELFWRQAEAAAVEQRWIDVIETCLEALSLDLPGERMMYGEATRRVRWDRAFQGAISAALQSAPDDQRTALEAILAGKWESTRTSDEPFALQQLEHRWRTVPWTRAAALDDGDAIFLGIGLFGRDLWLRSAMDSTRQDIQRNAAWQLRNEWKNAGFLRDAGDLDLRLLRRFPGQVVDADATVRHRLIADESGNAALLHRLNFGPPESWPATTPQVTPRNDPAEDALQTPIPIDADADGVWDRMDVTIDRQGRTLRFSGNGERGTWTVALPKGPTPLQQYPLTYQGWGLGRWLVVRVGTLLLAVTPWNEQGEPDARLVWSLDVVGPSLQSQEQLIVERQISTWKQAHERFRILDPYGHDVAFVGPVRAGYLCYLRRGKLIAVETQTGRQLWERWDVPPGVIPLGCEDRIALWTPEQKRVEVLDTADGRTLAIHACEFAREDAWHVDGCRIWSGEIGNDVTLYCHDLSTDQRLWTRTFPSQSLPVGLDDLTGAVLDPRGVVHLIDLDTGTTLDEPLTADMPKSIERVIVGRDEFRWYLGISGPVERSIDWLSQQPLNGFRRPLLQGPMLAIDRSQRQIVWRRDVPGEPWALDQPRSLPVLLQVFKQPPPQGGPAIGEGVIRLIDQRTGRDVFTHRDLNLLPYASFDPFPEFEKFELRLNNTKFDVDYAKVKSP